MTDGPASRLSVHDIAVKSLELLRLCWPHAALATLVLTAVSMSALWLPGRLDGLDLRTGPALSLLYLILGTILSYWIVRELLRGLGYRMPPHRLGAFLALSLLSGLAILLGLALFIVPGIILWARWVIAGPLLVGSHSTVFQSLGDSWRETGPHFWPILIILVGLYLPSVMMDWPILNIEAAPLVVDLLIQMVANAAWVLSWIVGVALVALLVPIRQWEEVFG